MLKKAVYSGYDNVLGDDIVLPIEYDDKGNWDLQKDIFTTRDIMYRHCQRIREMVDQRLDEQLERVITKCWNREVRKED